MPDRVSQLTDEGMQAFTVWLRSGARGSVPDDLISDRKYARPVGEAEIDTSRQFSDRFEFGSYLVETLKPLDSRTISFDRGLWSWLAAVFFEQLCPANSDGSRTLRKDYVYVPSQTRIYYRHLVRTP